MGKPLLPLSFLRMGESRHCWGSCVYLSVCKCCTSGSKPATFSHPEHQVRNLEPIPLSWLMSCQGIWNALSSHLPCPIPTEGIHRPSLQNVSEFLSSYQSWCSAPWCCPFRAGAAELERHILPLETKEFLFQRTFLCSPSVLEEHVSFRST